MPLVTVFWNAQLVREKDMFPVVNALRNVVAIALAGDEPEAKLAPVEVEVKVHQLGRFDDFGRNTGLAIIIDAADFPSRKANLAARRQAIIRGVKEFKHRSTHGFVWVRLVPSSFGSF